MEYNKDGHNHKKNNFTINKITFWKFISGILGLLLIISAYSNFSNRSDIHSRNVIPLDTAAKDAVDYINNYLVQPGANAVLNSKIDAGELYNIKIDIGEQEVELYLTKDGKLLFPNAIDLGEIPSVATGQQAQGTPLIEMSGLYDDDAMEGDENAPVTIIEWSDYECPFCGRFYSETLGQIRSQYIETGKAKLIFRDFPLSFHPQAQKAAEAAECAGEQGKYFEMHNLLFEEGVSGGIGLFKQYATDIGLDTSKFNDCLDSGKMASEVAKDMQDGSAAGISGTPGFIINGQLVSGAQLFSVFQQIIEAELAK